MPTNIDGKELKRASVYYFVGNIFSTGFAFITVPIFTRILSTSDYGIVNTFNAWTSILCVVMGLAIYMGIRAAFIDFEDCINDFMSVCTTFTLVCSAVVSTVVFCVIQLFDIKVSLLLVALCLAQGLATSILQNFSMYLMMRYQYKQRTALMILPNLISAIISIIVIKVYLKTDLFMGRIVPTVLIHIVFGIIVICAIYLKSHVLFKIEYLKYALKISSPLVLHAVALYILSQSDRTMITWLADASQTGIYSLIYNFSMVATVITTALDGIWIPWFVQKLKGREIDIINKVAIDYIDLMAYAMIGVILLGPEVVKLLAPMSYWEGISIIPPVVVSNFLIFAYSLYVNLEHYHKKTVYITANTLLAAGANIILNFIFIPRYGYIAAAFTTLVSYLISFVLHSKYARKIEKNLYPIKVFLRPSIHILCSIVVFYIFLDQWYVRWPCVVIYLIAMIYRERFQIGEYFPALQKVTLFRRKKN